MNATNKIPGYTLTDQAKRGVLIADLQDHATYQQHAVSSPHRDDHFTILIVSSGSFGINLDFESIHLTNPSFLLIFPEQVHHIGKLKKIQGWVINITPSAIYPEILTLISEYLTRPILLEKTAVLTTQLYALLQTATILSRESFNVLIEKTISLTINAALSLVISAVLPESQASAPKNRGAVIYKEFKALLEQHFKTWKQASQYASALSITATHLNDTIKEQTGLTVTAHIQQRSILEAKRLLSFTDNSVSEISYETGYNDPVYFGKLFKNLSGLTPLAFRRKFRD